MSTETLSVHEDLMFDLDMHSDDEREHSEEGGGEEEQLRVQPRDSENEEEAQQSPLCHPDSKQEQGSGQPSSSRFPETKNRFTMVKVEPPQETKESTNFKDGEQRKKVSLDDFEILCVLGKGSYGKVFQCKKKDSNKIYAMKVLRKADVIAGDTIACTNSERMLLETVDCPFVVALRFAFQTSVKLYLIMDYVHGGDMFGRLERAPGYKLCEEEVKFYAAQLAITYEYLHERSIIYRDLKPENILIDQRGFIRLTDFGFAKRIHDDRTDTFCGTVDYMAPEIVMKRGHGKASDWWSLGVVLYEMLVGKPPFQGNNRKQTINNIMSKKLTFPSFVKPKMRGLLKGLLNRTAHKRLKLHQFLAHPLFPSDFDWNAIRQKTAVPLYVPECVDAMDVSDFGAEFTEMDAIDSPVSKPTSVVEDHDHHFKSFSYVGMSPTFQSAVYGPSSVPAASVPLSPLRLATSHHGHGMSPSPLKQLRQQSSPSHTHAATTASSRSTATTAAASPGHLSPSPPSSDVLPVSVQEKQSRTGILKLSPPVMSHAESRRDEHPEQAVLRNEEAVPVTLVKLKKLNKNAKAFVPSFLQAPVEVPAQSVTSNNDNSSGNAWRPEEKKRSGWAALFDKNNNNASNNNNNSSAPVEHRNKPASSHPHHSIQGETYNPWKSDQPPQQQHSQSRSIFSRLIESPQGREQIHQNNQSMFITRQNYDQRNDLYNVRNVIYPPL